MHELHAASQILKTALAEAKRHKLRTIDRIVIELGKIQEHGDLLHPTDLRHNLLLLAKHSIASRAKILIKKSKKAIIKLVEIEGQK